MLRYFTFCPPSPTVYFSVFSLSETNTCVFLTRHELVDFYNPDGACLLRGTDLIFIYRPLIIRTYGVRTCVWCADIHTHTHTPSVRPSVAPLSSRVKVVELSASHKTLLQFPLDWLPCCTRNVISDPLVKLSEPAIIFQ